MNILFCGDKNIQNGLLIAVISLLEHTKEDLDVFVLTLNMSGSSAISSANNLNIQHGVNLVDILARGTSLLNKPDVSINLIRSLLSYFFDNSVLQ